MTLGNGGAISRARGRVQAGKLQLVPVEGLLATVDFKDRHALSSALNASVPEEWPPAIVKDHSSPNGGDWWLWYVLRTEENENPTLIGVTGLKGWSDAGSAVQTGCAFLPQFQNGGHGTAVMDSITKWALEHPSVESVIVDIPVNHPSAEKVLTNLKFKKIISENPDFLRFSKER